jgi:hypothetical protein
MLGNWGWTEKTVPWPWMRLLQFAFFAKWGWASLVNIKRLSSGKKS